MIKTFRDSFINNTIDTTIISVDDLKKDLLPATDYHNISNSSHIPYPERNWFLNRYFSAREIEKIKQFKIFKRQLEWIAGRYTIKCQIKEKFPEIDYKTLVIEAKEGGAPYLEGYPDWNISISHSRSFAAGAISYDKNKKLGIDIEKIGELKSQEFKRLVFTDREIEHLKDKEPKTMYISWCIKEAYLKLIEKGFDVSMKKIEILDDKIFINDILNNDLIVLTETFEENYIFAVVCDK